MDEPIESCTFVYTPEIVSRWFRRWPELELLALNPQTARGLLEPGQTREVPKLAKQKGHHSDPMVFAVVHADLTRAWRALPAGLGLQTVWACTRGIRLGRYAAQIQRRRADVYAAFDTACEMMALFLGWEPPVEEE